MAIGEGFSDVLLAAQLGAEWAWRVIYRDLSPSLIGYLRLHGVQEPEDLTGEVFVHVVRGLRNFSGDEAQFRSWIFLIAHHRMLDDRRSRSRKPSEPVELRSIEQHGPIGNSEEEALDQLSVAEVRRLLEGLSDAQRHVLLLRVIGGLTLEETAAVIGKRVSSVKALQRRATGAIRRKGLIAISESSRSLAAGVA
jgi:RNA polymerase sigma-70 factor (ECF subfamily)